MNHIGKYSGVTPFFGVPKSPKNILACTVCHHKSSKILAKNYNGFCNQCCNPLVDFQKFYNPLFGVPYKVKEKRKRNGLSGVCPAEAIDMKYYEALKKRYG